MSAVAEAPRLIVSHEVTLELYLKMLTVALVEARLQVFSRQAKCTFQASTRGHEKLQIGKDVSLWMLSRAGDPCSNGGNMPGQISSLELNLVSQTAVTGSQYLPAAGMSHALKTEGAGRPVYVSLREGATSEGEFFEALNWASRERLPVLFTVQNNGYAISTRQSVQTGSTVRQIAMGFGLRTFHVDGTWFEDICDSLPPAIEEVRHGRGGDTSQGQWRSFADSDAPLHPIGKSTAVSEGGTCLS